ncbi:hypothetical protein EJ04DRAFT_5645 [Polyplosphaeria fusca]|uniref:Uncharacterized protein n=1 Tax=Polyplosphaeria fusca TaxID=682080 RepID=A0A9P4R9E8_9PLEO|nr:hypothetical protein EJ04DRAFT_5645 [Polyplosphaeria fusca]
MESTLHVPSWCVVETAVAFVAAPRVFVYGGSDSHDDVDDDVCPTDRHEACDAASTIPTQLVKFSVRCTFPPTVAHHINTLILYVCLAASLLISQFDSASPARLAAFLFLDPLLRSVFHFPSLPLESILLVHAPHHSAHRMLETSQSLQIL